MSIGRPAAVGTALGLYGTAGTGITCQAVPLDHLHITGRYTAPIRELSSQPVSSGWVGGKQNPKALPRFTVLTYRVAKGSAKLARA